MLRVGLTGGLGCGKSLVGAELERLGCFVIRADEVGHAVLSPGAEAYSPVLEAFGPELRNPDGTIDRRKLAALVFHSSERLAVLNSIVHPAVFRREEQLISAAAASGENEIAVVEAAVLIEAGNYRAYDRIVVVTCAEAQQIERAMKRDGTTSEAIEARLRHQMPVSEKVKYADFVIDGSGTVEQTLEQTRTVYARLRK
ncbi:MAG: dephospho-CoA kinase [Bryobacteraceae bacterium]|nr:dephospho-CoA kinase [Bryobacteraceae bacterium]